MLDQEEVKKIVDETIDLKINYYKKMVYAFLSGLGLLFIFLVANGLLSKKAIIVTFHEMIFGNHEEIAVSYNNHFKLGSGEGAQKQQTVYFYSTQGQEVDAFINILHHGKGRLHKVTIGLDYDEDPIFNHREDQHFSKFSLTKKLNAQERFLTADGNVHVLSFSIDRIPEDASDLVFVQVLINVQGGKNNET